MEALLLTQRSLLAMFMKWVKSEMVLDKDNWEALW